MSKLQNAIQGRRRTLNARIAAAREEFGGCKRCGRRGNRCAGCHLRCPGKPLEKKNSKKSDFLLVKAYLYVSKIS